MSRPLPPFEDRPAPDAGAADASPGPRPVPSHPRVLVVDDDAATRVGLAELLRAEGYRCTSLGAFDLAREAIRVSPPDVLITDIRLGTHNGLHLVLTSPRRTIAIVMSGYADPVLAAEAMRIGAAACLRKPVNPRMLLELLREKLAVVSRVAQQW